MNIKAGWIILGVLVILIAISAAVLSMNPAKLDLPSGIMPITRTSNLPVLATRMPDFQGITRWWNTPDDQPLTAESLKGKVVFVDFWTYSCINCIRTQPFMKKIWETYKDDGLVIVGVHTPEFAFEKVPANVEEAFKKAGLEYPIALDPEFATWNAYNNRYWPAGYFFDRKGQLRFTHFGEGSYDEQEEVIRELLAEGTTLTDPMTGAGAVPRFDLTKTHETYFGSARSENFVSVFDEVGPNQWSTEGTWSVTPEYAASEQAGNRFRMNMESNAMHLVLGSMSGGSKRIKVIADGKTLDPITVSDRRLYTIARFPNGGRHTIDLEILDAGVEFYAATFGE